MAALKADSFKGQRLAIHQAQPTSALLVLWLSVFAVVWFATLGGRSLIHSDEGRYATLALEMAASGDWVTPRLNGLLYFEKPVLQYWIGALFFRALGVSEFTARLWPGLAGFFTIAAIAGTARRLWGRDAAVQTLAVASSMTWIVLNAHFLTLDAGLTFFLTVALCAMLLAECSAATPDIRRRWVWCAWVAAAGAVLSKGLVGLLIPGCSALLASVWLRDAGLLRRMRPLSGALICAALAAPWFVLVSLRNPGFAHFFFIHEHVERYLSNAHHREGAWWYYLPPLLLGLLPWTSGFPWLMRGRSAALPQDRRALTLLLAWSSFVLVFFSASGSKLQSYILPMFPSLALLTVYQLRRVQFKVLRWHLLVPLGFWLLALVVSPWVPRWVEAGAPPDAGTALRAGMQAGAMVALGGGAVAWWFLGRAALSPALLALAMGHFVGTSLVMHAHDRFGQVKSGAPIASALLPQIDPATPVFGVRSYDQTLPFYLGRHVMLVDYVDEFAFGEGQEPDRWIPTLGVFEARWRELPKAAAYMGPDTWATLRAGGLPMRVVYQDARRVVVAKP